VVSDVGNETAGNFSGFVPFGDFNFATLDTGSSDLTVADVNVSKKLFARL